MRDEPELARLLQVLNAQDGFFRIVGCERWYNDNDEATGESQFGSHVGFMLDAWPSCDARASQWIAEHFRDYGDKLEWTESMKMMFELVPTILYSDDMSGWSLDFWAWGFGSSRQEAPNAWAVIIERFRTFILEDNARWRDFLAKHPVWPPKLDADNDCPIPEAP